MKIFKLASLSRSPLGTATATATSTMGQVHPLSKPTSICSPARSSKPGPLHTSKKLSPSWSKMSISNSTTANYSIDLSPPSDPGSEGSAFLQASIKRSPPPPVEKRRSVVERDGVQLSCCSSDLQSSPPRSISVSSSYCLFFVF